MKIGLVGAGAMGEAIVASLLRGQLLAPSDIRIADVVQPRIDFLSSQYGVEAAKSAADAVAGADYAIFAVKPQDFEKAAKETGPLPQQSVALSIMAGVTLSRLSAALHHEAIVRAMPNTPAQIGEGMTAWTATPAVAAAARADVGRIFDCLGHQVMVPDERYIDMATGVSGSGPGFVFLFIEAFIDAAVLVGLARDTATQMVLQTVAGSALYAQSTGKHPAELRNLVTSPGGTTAEGLKALEAGGIRAAITDAVVAAYNKSRALGGA